MAMLSSIPPTFLHIIVSSNTTQSAQSNALKFLWWPSVEVP